MVEVLDLFVNLQELKCYMKSLLVMVKRLGFVKDVKIKKLHL